ncbi:hypothetical protein LT493_44015 [Streptomyces tricolor]|nr:hypothetical protein [Streptomyces tricolor]
MTLAGTALPGAARHRGRAGALRTERTASRRPCKAARVPVDHVRVAGANHLWAGLAEEEVERCSTGRPPSSPVTAPGG